MLKPLCLLAGTIPPQAGNSPKVPLRGVSGATFPVKCDGNIQQGIQCIVCPFDA